MRLRAVHGLGIMAPRHARVKRAAFADTFNAAEVLGMRPEDRNLLQVRQAFAELQVTPMAWQARAGGSHAL